LYHNNPFKLELIDGIPGDTVGIARQGDFYDLCRGGHVESTGDIQHFTLLDVSGSYWRADRSNQPLQRIRGTVFFTEQELTTHLQRREDALKYDHRKLGKQLDLFSFHDEGPGFPFWHAKGKTILNTLIHNLRPRLEQAGYQEIATPILLNDTLWKQSGHYEHYKDNMYFCSIDDTTYALRPMNCPGSILIYKERPRSYRELPVRLAEFGLVHRYELSGVLHGLFRVRAFTQDDGHIYCMASQIEDEVVTTIGMIYQVLHQFDFGTIEVRLATRPAKSMGSDELWQKAIQALAKALERCNVPYAVFEGEGAFYGPKIEFHIKDSMERSWQCSTVQVDFFLPENFDLSYIAAHGHKERPVMIHRAIYGSLERFVGILLEHCKGKLPFWIAPVQARILPISDEQQPYAQSLLAQLKDAGLRIEVDTSSDTLSAKIKVAQLDYIPWMLVVGKKEAASGTVTLRHLDGKQEANISIAELIAKTQAQ
jgi:threonyl-tRNA synthetase